MKKENIFSLIIIAMITAAIYVIGASVNGYISDKRILRMAKEKNIIIVGDHVFRVQEIR